jgi:hypothetical protein
VEGVSEDVLAPVVSTVELADRALSVTTRLLVDPEPLFVTYVRDGDEVLDRAHVPLAPALVGVLAERGAAGLTSSLYACHLRFVRRLLAGGEAEPDSEARAPACVVAHAVVGLQGETLRETGLDHVPGSWVSAVPQIAHLARIATAAVGLAAELDGVLVAGEGVAALVLPEAERLRVAFLRGDASAAWDEPAAFLRALRC